MSDTGAGILLLLMFYFLGAGVFEAWLALRAHPRRWLYGWLAWTPLAILCLLAIGVARSQSGVALAVTSLTFGPLFYPFARLALEGRYSSRYSTRTFAAEEYEREQERLRVHATDFGGVRVAREKPAPGAKSASDARAVTQAPLTRPSGEMRLAQVVSPRESAWTKGMEGAVLFAVGAALVALPLGLRFSGFLFDTGAPFAVAESLEGLGHPYARVKRNWWTPHCPLDNFAYDWTAMGSQGRACVSRIDGEILIKVDRIWPADPR